MTIDQAIEMHKAMQKGANKMLSQIAVHSFMINMREEFEEVFSDTEDTPTDINSILEINDHCKNICLNYNEWSFYFGHYARIWNYESV